MSLAVIGKQFCQRVFFTVGTLLCSLITCTLTMGFSTLVVIEAVLLKRDCLKLYRFSQTTVCVTNLILLLIAGVFVYYLVP
jgi:sugar phosphate permease